MLNWIAKQFIRFYQKFISPLLIPSCRFHPSCSDYCYQALERYSFLRASGLTLIRLAKCHPYHPGGRDPLK